MKQKVNSENFISQYKKNIIDIENPGKDSIVFKIKESSYYSEYDEAAFYEWLDKIDSVENYVGFSGYLHIKVKRKISEYDFRDLFALYRRYKLDYEPLNALANTENQMWINEYFEKI